MNELKLGKCKHKRRSFHQLFKCLIYVVGYCQEEWSVWLTFKNKVCTRHRQDNICIRHRYDYYYYYSYFIGEMIEMLSN